MKYYLRVSACLLLITWCACTPCTEVERVDISAGQLFDNGSVFFDGLEYAKSSWFEVTEDGRITRFGCPCVGGGCMWKCCGRGQVFFNAACTGASNAEVNPFNPPLFKGRVSSEKQAYGNFHFMYGRPCNDSYLVDTAVSNEELFIQENGTLMEVAPGGTQWHLPRRYCVDMMLHNSSVPPRLVAIVCFPEEVSTDDSPVLYTAYAVGLLLSVPFLLATFLVYALIPDLRNLHGMCLMAYCAGLIIGYPFLAYLKLHIGTIGVAMTGCWVIAFIVYYAFQTSFFWLNVMCFDIWRTFSGYRGGSTNKRRDQRRFCFYALYAWGVPALLTAVTAAMQFSEGLPDFIVRPGFGSRRCWFVDWLSELVYFFTPVFILVICNVIFFSETSCRIRTIRQETAILKGAESSRSDKLKKDKQRYALYLKLFVVMGVNWTVELISFAVGGSNWYWVVVDISNIALGVFIFFIFVWKKKTRNLVHKRFRQILGMPPTPTDSRAGRWTTSSAPTEDTRISADETAIRLKDMH